MKGKFLKKVAKNPKLLILTEIKRSQGLSVSELCDRIGLSYMGVKQHCIALEREGYLDTWRRPKGMGRPEKAYRLTDGAQEFFPTEFSNFTTQILNSIEEVYGPNAPEKILFNIYQHEAEQLCKETAAMNLADRCAHLAAHRDEKGYMSEVENEAANGIKASLRIVEYNSPILDCIARYPILRDLERKMFERVLGVSVQRNEERISGLYKCVFTIDSAE